MLTEEQQHYQAQLDILWGRVMRERNPRQYWFLLEEFQILFARLMATHPRESENK
jgi:hypothetical protein